MSVRVRGAATVVAYLEREASLTGRLAAALGLDARPVCGLVGWLLTTAESIRASSAPRAPLWRGALMAALREGVFRTEFEPTSELAAQESWLRLAPWLEAVTGSVDGQALGVHVEPDLTAAAVLWRGNEAMLTAESGPGVAATASWMSGLQNLGDWLSPRLPPVTGPIDVARFDELVLRAGTVVEEAHVSSRALAPIRRVEDLFPELGGDEPLPPVIAAAAELDLVPGPAIYVIESPPGTEKTDAALYLASRLLAQGDGDRLLVVRPWSGPVAIEPRRIDRVAQRLFVSPEHILQSSGRRSRREWFKQVTAAPVDREAAVEALEGWMGEETRRAWLGPSGTVPLEEAALAVLPAPLTSLRSLALGRSVLVVDHFLPSDTYGQRCLLTLLDAHTRLGGSAIVTTTALTRELHRRLAEAVGPEAELAPARVDRGQYPRISVCSLDDRFERALLHDERPLSVELIDDKPTAIARLLDAVEAGKAACWARSSVEAVEDGVARILATGRIERERVHVFHERFVDGDRAEHELELAVRFGPESPAKKRAGRLLIASPAISRGLDVDFDFVLSDLAPLDALLERSALAMRHPRGANGERVPAGEGGGERTLHVLAPPFDESPPTDWVYRTLPTLASAHRDHGLLWLSLRALRAHAGAIYPEDYRALLDSVLGENAHELVPWTLWNAADPEGTDASPARTARLTPMSPTTPRRAWTMLAQDACPGPEATEATVLRLARRAGGTLLPLVASVTSGWDQSRVVVPRRLAVRRATDAHDAEIAVASMLMPDRGRWALTLVLSWDPAALRWHGDVVGEDGRLRRVTYDRSRGLSFALLDDRAPEFSAPPGPRSPGPGGAPRT